MPGLFDGKTALVTGASKGLGRSISQHLAKEGAHIIAVARPSEALIDLENELGPACTTWAEDVTGGAVPDRLEQLPSLDILVNNAGTNVPEPITEVTDETLDRIIDLNVKATFRLCRAAARVMREGAAIVNMTSQMGHVGSPGRTVYCMTKHAVEGLTKAMAIELAPRGIRVNSVAPTFVETPMTKPMLSDPNFKSFVKQMIPMGRIASPEDVAAAVAYLCAPHAGMVTGHSLLVDGGWTAQ